MYENESRAKLQALWQTLQRNRYQNGAAHILLKSQLQEETHIIPLHTPFDVCPREYPKACPLLSMATGSVPV